MRDSMMTRLGLLVLVAALAQARGTEQLAAAEREARATEQLAAAEREALVEGDECGTPDSDAGGCALNALQRSAARLGAGRSGSPPPDVPPSEPDLKRFSNLSLRDLGLDELRRLAEAARAALEERLADATEPAPAPPASRAPTSESASAALGCRFRSYTGQHSGAEFCFCQLAQNEGCAGGSSCACPQGCGPAVVWPNADTVTFKNRARATGCSPSTVLLTAPRSYYRTTSDLKSACGGGAASLLQVMLEDSWDQYQSKVGAGPVNQCFHNPQIASVKYLHLQTFCLHGEFHAMPTGNRRDHVGFCVTMSGRGEAGSLAAKLSGWL